MALPHPKSRKDKYRNGDKPNNGGVVWKFFKRTINITDYRNAKDEVNQARNPTFGGINHHSILFLSEFAVCFFPPLTPEFWIVSAQKNEGGKLAAVQESMHKKRFSRLGFHLIYFEILQDF